MSHIQPPILPDSQVQITSEKLDSPISATVQKTISPIGQTSQSVFYYNPAYPQFTNEFVKDLIDFFALAPKYRDGKELVYLKDGEVKEITKQLPVAPPMLSEFCRQKGVRYTDLKRAAKVIPELEDAMLEAMEVVKEFLVFHGLTGTYASQFAIFATKNMTDWTDKQVTEQRTVDVNKLADFLEGDSRTVRKVLPAKEVKTS